MVEQIQTKPSLLQGSKQDRETRVSKIERERECLRKKRKKERSQMGFETRRTCTTILVGMLMLWVCYTVESIPNTRVKVTLCNTRVYFKGDPFTISLAYVLSELEGETPKHAGYDYRNISPFPNAFAYGHATCNHSLTSTDCGICLVAAKTAMLSGCDSRIGAHSELVDCSIRYEQYPFCD